MRGLIPSGMRVDSGFPSKMSVVGMILPFLVRFAMSRIVRSFMPANVPE